MSALDRWIFGAFPANRLDLGVYRLLFVGWLLAFDLPRALWVTGQPQFLFNPPAGFAAWATGFPSHATLWGLNAAYAGLLLLLLAGRLAVPAALGAAAVRITLNGWAYADGKIDHEVLPTVVLLALAGSGWAKSFGIDDLECREDHRRDRSGSWALSLLALLIALSMFTAGWDKLSTGWLRTDRQATLSHLVANHFAIGRQTWLSTQILQVRWTAFWELHDWAAVVMELAFLPALLHRRAFQTLCVVACWFHLGVLLTFGIGFAHNVVAYAAFVPWSALVGNGTARTRRLVCQAFLAIGCLAALLASMLERPAAPASGIPTDGLLYLAPPFGSALLALWLWHRWTEASAFGRTFRGGQPERVGVRSVPKEHGPAPSG